MMTTTTTWTIAQLDRNAADGGVTVAHWRATAADGDYSASAYGTAGFTPDPTSPSFKPYAQLTEADVLAWVWGQLDKGDIESSLAAQVAAQKAPVTLTGTPW
jgi:hypothetical protein